MIVYILMFIISLIIVMIAEKVERKPIKILLYILTVIPFFLVSALRYDLGIDYTKRYVSAFNKIARDGYIRNTEIGFQYLIRLCLKFSNDSSILFVVTSAITLALIMTTIFIKSKKVTLSVILFFLFGLFFNSLNLVRQYIAIGFVLLGYIFLSKEKCKWWDYCIFIILNSIAVLFHTTSAICFVLLFLNQKKLASWKWLVPVGLIIIVLNRKLIYIVEFIIQNTRYIKYLSGKTSGTDLSILQLLVNICIYIFMGYIYYKNKKLNNVKREMIFGINLQAVTIVLITLGAVHMLFNRIALYFSVFQLISIPYFIVNMPVDEIIKDFNKTFKNKVNFDKLIPKFELIVVIFWIVLGVGLFGYTNIKNNDNVVLPYKTVINKEWQIK